MTTRLDTLRTLGYVFAAVLVLGLVYTLIAGRARLDRDRIVTAAAVFVIGVPFLLPGMHERYFYLADVVTVVLAFYRPQLWPVPVLVQAASLLSYGPFLFSTAPLVNLKILAVLMLTALLWTLHALGHDLRVVPPTPPDATPPDDPAKAPAVEQRDLVDA